MLALRRRAGILICDGSNNCPITEGRTNGGGRLVIVKLFHLTKPLGHESALEFLYLTIVQIRLNRTFVRQRKCHIYFRRCSVVPHMVMYLTHMHSSLISPDPVARSSANWLYCVSGGLTLRSAFILDSLPGGHPWHFAQ